jgi:hypothetical protein
MVVVGVDLHSFSTREAGRGRLMSSACDYVHEACVICAVDDANAARAHNTFQCGINCIGLRNNVMAGNRLGGQTGVPHETRSRDIIVEHE